MYSFVGGEEELGRYGWYGEDGESGSTHGVGLLKPCQMGLYDMHGNVWEWCGDWYGKYSNEVEMNPMGAPRGSYRVYRVLRGGSWISGSGYCRSAVRSRYVPVNRRRSDGFRLVCREAGSGGGSGGVGG